MSNDAKRLLQATAMTELLDFFLLYNEIPAFPCPKRLEKEHVARLPISSAYQIVVNLPCVNIKVFLKHELVKIRLEWSIG